MRFWVIPVTRIFMDLLAMLQTYLLFNIYELFYFYVKNSSRLGERFTSCLYSESIISTNFSSSYNEKNHH